MVEGTISREFDELLNEGTYQWLIKKTGALGAECATAIAAEEFQPNQVMDAFGEPTEITGTNYAQLTKFSQTLDASNTFEQAKLEQNL